MSWVKVLPKWRPSIYAESGAYLMRDDLTTYLISDRKHRPSLSPEALELMGKQAANRFLDEGIPLNEGIAKLASEHADINADQVRRVVEFANKATYLGLHDKAKTAGAKESYPQFALADSTVILGSLGEEASPLRTPTVDTDYSSSVEKRASIEGTVADNLLADLFQVKKTAEVAHTRDAVVEEIVSVKEDLTSLRDHLTHTASTLDTLWKEAQEDYYDHVRRHMLNGGSLADVVASSRIPGVEQEKISSALQPFVVRLLKDKVASPAQMQEQVKGFEKVAHRILNENHPLVTTFRAYLSLDSEIQKVASGLTDVEVELGRVNSFIKEKFCGGTSAR
jgi:hypothetical protein